MINLIHTNLDLMILGFSVFVLFQRNSKDLMNVIHHIYTAYVHMSMGPTLRGHEVLDPYRSYRVDIVPKYRP